MPHPPVEGCCPALRENVGHLAGIPLCRSPCRQHLRVCFLAHSEDSGSLEVSLCSQLLFAAFADCCLALVRRPGPQQSRASPAFRCLAPGEDHLLEGPRCSFLVLVPSSFSSGKALPPGPLSLHFLSQSTVVFASEAERPLLSCAGLRVSTLPPETQREPRPT